MTPQVEKHLISIVIVMVAMVSSIVGQETKPIDKQKVRTVTVPISIFTKKELKTDQTEEFIQADRLIVREDKEEQTILSIRSITNTPLALQVLIQDDLSGNINLQLSEIATFIRSLPRGSRVMVAYIHGGTLLVRTKFTEDLEKAARSLRIIATGSTPSGNGPYGGVSDAVGRFDGLPSGRRAIFLVSDGLDASQGLTAFASLQSIELDQAITRSQRRGIAIYSIYSPTLLTESGNAGTVASAQAALSKLSDETGGRAFFSGSLGPVSFEPYFKDMSLLLSRQFALTYLSTHMKKGYHKLEIISTNPEVKIEHPKGYFYR
ncbi:MAG TPA: hypothetical protein PLD38_13045 [Pyrinomonadaceae bacterium]|nr:hypothetical protein [Chloracidobacterium sp.]MBP9936892.1 hypothetical protein [Pyrinomonadaceae bacterium]MBK7803750.1 hypothetical protein [Chloracidobacterium sp.]MBK9439577.1 hypothetical protein [Chloracidobacterium sp.]MBL0239135.1 hypothetical protein [Chloracidobacterium sp.]